MLTLQFIDSQTARYFAQGLFRECANTPTVTANSVAIRYRTKSEYNKIMSLAAHYNTNEL